MASFSHRVFNEMVSRFRALPKQQYFTRPYTTAEQRRKRENNVFIYEKKLGKYRSK